jgi:hypothetical protein
MTDSQTSKPIYKKLFTQLDAHPVALNFCMLQEFGPAFLAWEHETCWDEVKKTFGVFVSDANKQKIQAMRALYVASEPYEEWQVFEVVAAGLVGLVPRVDMVQKPTPGRALMALDVMNHVRSGAIKEEVYRYCAAVLMDSGMVYGPGALEPCNAFITGDTSSREQVKNLTAHGKLPVISSGDDTVYVQAMKSLSIKDFGASMEARLAEQIRQLRG